jgi:uncharacterized membrane protein
MCPMSTISTARWLRRRAARGALTMLGAATLLTLTSCGSGTQPLAVVDPGAAPLTPTYAQVKSILDAKCLPCHRGGGDVANRARPSATSESSLSAHSGSTESSPLATSGEGSDYSTCQGIQAGLAGIRHTAIDRVSMPPGALPRLSEREKLILSRWIDQGACSPCTVCR